VPTFFIIYKTLIPLISGVASSSRYGKSSMLLILAYSRGGEESPY
jgi:hypothetical protein